MENLIDINQFRNGTPGRVFGWNTSGYPSEIAINVVNITIESHGFQVFDVLGISDGALELWDGTQEYAGIVTDVVDPDTFVLQSGGIIMDPGISEGDLWYAQDDGTLDPETESDLIAIIGIAEGVGIVKAALGGGSGLAYTPLNKAGDTATGQIVFSVAPRLSSTTASQFLKTDGDKDVVSVDAASTSDVLTATDTNKPLVSASLASLESVVDLGDVSGSVTIDLSTGRKFKCVATGNITSLSFTNEKVGAVYMLRIEVNTTNKTIAFAAGKFDWPHGSAAPPQLTQATTNGSSPAKAVDIFTMACMESGRLVLGVTPNVMPN